MQNNELIRQIEEWKKSMNTEITRIALERPKNDDIALFSVEGKEVELKKKRKHIDPDEDIRKAIKSLNDQGIAHTSNNIKKMGFGRKAIQEFTKRFPSEMILAQGSGS